MHSVNVLLTAATVSFHALEVLTSPVSLSLDHSFWMCSSWEGSAEPRETVILHTAKCKMNECTLIFPFWISRLNIWDLKEGLWWNVEGFPPLAF